MTQSETDKYFQNNQNIWRLILERPPETPITLPAGLEILAQDIIETGQYLLILKGEKQKLRSFLNLIRPYVPYLSVESNKGEILRLSSGLIISPYPLPEENCICLKSKGAFGSGLHPTTRLCLSLLDEKFTPREIPFLGLDVGAGSGILSLVAAKKGGQMLALEIDPQAALICTQNIASNRLEKKIHVICGGIETIRGRFHLILANLYLRLLIPLASEIIKLLAPGGILILSGFWESTLSQIYYAYRKLILLETRLASPWAGTILQKPPDLSLGI